MEDEDEEVVARMAQGKFSIKQVLAIIMLVSGVSGSGGALTAWSNDDRQDEKIAENAATVAAVQEQSKQATEEIIKLKEKVVAVGGKVDDLKTDIRSDVSELRALVIRALEGNGHP